jgi:hypothetical protein
VNIGCHQMNRVLTHNNNVSEKCQPYVLEKVLDACQGFQRDVEEVGAGVYPPQELAELAANAGWGCTSCDL